MSLPSSSMERSAVESRTMRFRARHRGKKKGPIPCQDRAFPGRQPILTSALAAFLWNVSLLHENVGQATQHEDGRDCPQQNNRHGSLLWLPHREANSVTSPDVPFAYGDTGHLRSRRLSPRETSQAGTGHRNQILAGDFVWQTAI